MPQIIPTPAAGTWLRIDSVGFTAADEYQPRAGTWLRIVGSVGPSQPRAGTWLRIDSVGFVARANKVSVGMLLAN